MKLDMALQQLEIGRKSKRLQNLWPMIEQKLAEGVAHAKILDLLNQSGFDLTERTYKSYLYRYRKRRRINGKKRDPTCLTQSTTHQAADMVQGLTDPAPAEVERHKRPPTFDYDPRGISPDLLK